MNRMGPNMKNSDQKRFHDLYNMPTAIRLIISRTKNVQWMSTWAPFIEKGVLIPFHWLGLDASDADVDVDVLISVKLQYSLRFVDRFQVPDLFLLFLVVVVVMHQSWVLTSKVVKVFFIFYLSCCCWQSCTLSYFLNKEPALPSVRATDARTNPHPNPSYTSTVLVFIIITIKYLTTYRTFLNVKSSCCL